MRPLRLVIALLALMVAVAPPLAHASSSRASDVVSVVVPLARAAPRAACARRLRAACVATRPSARAGTAAAPAPRDRRPSRPVPGDGRHLYLEHRALLC